MLALDSALSHCRLGLIVPKRNVRRAVDRNRVKRAVRETFRVWIGAPDRGVLSADLVIRVFENLSKGEIEGPVLWLLDDWDEWTRNRQR